MESASPTDRQGHVAFDLYNLSGCDQQIRCLTHIAGNRLDLVIMDAPDIAEVFVDTPLGTYDPALSVVCFELSNLYPSTMSQVLFLKHRTNLDNVRCADIVFVTVLTK